MTVPRCVQALTVEGHLGSFQIWAITSKATVNINVQTRPFLRYQIGQENRELHKDAEQSTEVKTPLRGLANLPKMTFDPPSLRWPLLPRSWNLGSSRLCLKCLREVMEPQVNMLSGRKEPRSHCVCSTPGVRSLKAGEGPSHYGGEPARPGSECLALA